MNTAKQIGIAAASAIAVALAVPAFAQVSGGTSGGVQGEDVNASTSGYGSTDGTSTTIGGTADAGAANGGTADTNVRANVNDRRAMQRSTANARDDDERARSGLPGAHEHPERAARLDRPPAPASPHAGGAVQDGGNEGSDGRQGLHGLSAVRH